MAVERFGNSYMEKIWAIIPARSGSKGLKNKNILKINNKPLIYYTIKSALNSKRFEKVLFLTDSKKYAKIAQSYGAEIPFIRSKRNASNKSTDNDLYLNILKIFKKKNVQMPKFFAHLSPTVLYRKKGIISKGIEFFFKKKKSDFQSMRSVSLYPSSSYKHMRIINDKICSIIKKDFDANKLNYPRQSYKKTYKANGLIDIISRKNLEVNKTTHGKNTLAFLTNQVYIIDIDDKIQLKWANFLIKQKLIKI